TELQPLMDLTWMHTSAELDAAYPARWGAEVTLSFDDGETVELRTPAFRGSPGWPAGRPEIEAKAAGLLGKAAPDRLFPAADAPGGVEQEVGRRRPPAREVGPGVAGGHIPLLAGSRRGDRQPHHPDRGVFLLQRLHVAAVIVLADKRAAVIRPFEDDDLAGIIAEPDVLAGEVEGTELRRRIPRLCRCGARNRDGALHAESADCRQRGNS